MGAAQVLHVLSPTGGSGAVAAAAVLGGFVFFFFFFFDIAASEETRAVRSLLSPAQGTRRSLIGFGCGREGKAFVHVKD